MLPSSHPARSVTPPARLAAILTLVVLLFAACTGSVTVTSPSPSSVAVASATLAATATPSLTPAPEFPVTVTDDEGTAVTLPAEPQKVVSLTPAVTETLYAVGAGSRVVATDDSSDHPAEVQPLPDVVVFGTVDVEKIVSFDPDLVIAGGAGFTSAESIARLRSLDIPVLVVSTLSIEAIYNDIVLVGTVVGQTDAASALVEQMRADMTAIGEAAKAVSQRAGRPPRVFYDVGYLDATGQIFGAAEGSFLAEMIEMLGVDVITADAVTYEIPLETLIERDPEVIILGVNAFYLPTPAIIAKRTGWSALTAVKTGDVRSVTDTEITRPGPRLATGMRNLALAMYPDLVIPTAP